MKCRSDSSDGHNDPWTLADADAGGGDELVKSGKTWSLRIHRRGPRTTTSLTPTAAIESAMWWPRHGMPPVMRARWRCGGQRRRIYSGPPRSGGTAGSRCTRVFAVIPQAAAMRSLPPLVKKYALQMLYVLAPVTAAAMEQWVLDEYAAKHRVAIEKLLQLRVFVEMRDRFQLLLTMSEPKLVEQLLEI